MSWTTRGGRACVRRSRQLRLQWLFSRSATLWLSMLTCTPPSQSIPPMPWCPPAAAPDYNQPYDG
jgi:hypothetical protein